MLICVYANGQSSLSAESIGGMDVAVRTYVVRDHVMILTGHPSEILHSDTKRLLVSGVCRLPTPDEQERWVRQQYIRGMIQEGCANA